MARIQLVKIGDEHFVNPEEVEYVRHYTSIRADQHMIEVVTATGRSFVEPVPEGTSHEDHLEVVARRLVYGGTL